MEASFKATTGNKEERYTLFIPQLKSLIEGETDEISILANASAALHEAFGFLWTGFYLVKGEHLQVGPFQGSVACFRIPHGKGVCGTAWKERRTIVVPDVEQFPGHIACSSLSKSEIVVPLIWNGEVKGVLDIDSDRLATFDQTDAIHLEEIVNLIAQQLYE